MNTLMVALACLVAGCSTDHYSRITAPSGAKGYEISCRSKGQCYRLAGILCPNGYRTIDQAHPHTLVVECKPDGAREDAP